MKNAKGSTAIVLIAGRGSRLRSVYSEGPKCLVRVAGQTILERQLMALEQCAIEKVVLVVGYRKKAITKALDSRCCGAITLVENNRFATTGTARSLVIGLAAVDPSSDLVLIEGDVIFDPRIVHSLFRKGHGTTALAKWGPQHSGSCAVCEEGRVRAWIHESRFPPGFTPEDHYKTVNLTYLPSFTWREGLTAALAETLLKDGERAPLEYALQRMLERQYHISGVIVDPLQWWEVDTPEDLKIAETMFKERADEDRRTCVES